VISISWGWPELEPLPGTNFAWTDAAITAVSETFEEAASLGTEQRTLRQSRAVRS